MSRTIRTLTLAEIETLLDWAADEGWNPGLDDAAPFRAADPSGFFGAFVDGQMVCGISAVRYGADFGFIGLYITRPDRRGQGHGRAVWDHAMAYLAGRTIGLDGVPARQADYAGMGFVPVYETIRFEGRVPETAPSADIVGEAGFETVAAYDRLAFPAQRPDFLAHWLAKPRRVRCLRVDGVMRGYAVCRPCRSGRKIGPLFADDLDAARTLIRAFPGPVQIDVPAARDGLIAWLENLGFTSNFTTMRMYRGPEPDFDMDKVFAITTLELG